MEENKILTMSENGKEEYCCSVVRVGTLTPVEGSDFLAKTDVYGTQIVVRKDQVNEGDIMFYAANETALNEKFLSVNNMFEIGCRDMNANASDVAEIMKEYEINYKIKADQLKIQAKNVKGSMEGMKKAIDKAKKSIKKIDEKYDTYDDIKKADADSEKKLLNEKIDELTQKSLEKSVVYTNLKKEIEELVEAGKPIVDEAKKLCGFFNKYGRVRCIVLKGCPSFGFLFGVDTMTKFCPEITELNLEEYVDTNFDTVNGELFVKAFVPPVKPENVKKTRDEKRDKKAKKFDRIVDGEFKFHYDTAALGRNMFMMSPGKVVTISTKIHGCVERSTIVNTKEYGDLTIGEIVDNKIDCHILARDIDSEQNVYVSIDQFYMVSNDGEWYEIELEDGTKLTITGNNPVWLPELNCYRRVDELVGDEYLLLNNNSM